MLIRKLPGSVLLVFHLASGVCVQGWDFIEEVVSYVVRVEIITLPSLLPEDGGKEEQRSRNNVLRVVGGTEQDPAMGAS